MLEHDTYAIKRQIDIHRAALLKEAANDRLLRHARDSRPKWQRRALRSIGGLLIAIGKRLQEPYYLSTAREAKAH